jgi:type II secretory pathway pseudopilin PulG
LQFRVARVASSRCLLAFTLIEVVVSLAIVVALGLLILPGLLNWSGSASDGAVVDEVQAAVDSARAIAIESGVPVNLTVRMGVSHDALTARWGVAQPPADERENGPGGELDAKQHERLLLKLPDRWRIRIPVAESALAGPSERQPIAPPSNATGRGDDASDGEPRPTWLILPDGTVDSAGASELVSPDGRRGLVQITPLAGIVRCEKLRQPELEEPADAESPDAEQSSPKPAASQPVTADPPLPEAP